MVHRETFRFGLLTPNSGSVPSVSNLNSRITPSNINQRGPNNLREEARNVEGNQSHQNRNYYYFTYATDVVQQDTQFDTSGGDQPLATRPRRVTHVIYFGDGSYIFESNSDISHARLASFLLDQNQASSGEFTIYDDLNQNYLLQIFNSATEVRKAQFENIDVPNPSNNEERRIDETGDECKFVTFSSGGQHNQINQAQLIADFASFSDIKSFSMVKPNRNNRTIVYKNSARVTTSYPENTTPGQEAIAILNDTYDVLNHLTP